MFVNNNRSFNTAPLPIYCITPVQDLHNKLFFLLFYFILLTGLNYSIFNDNLMNGNINNLTMVLVTKIIVIREFSR